MRPVDLSGRLSAQAGWPRRPIVPAGRLTRQRYGLRSALLAALPFRGLLGRRSTIPPRMRSLTDGVRSDQWHASRSTECSPTSDNQPSRRNAARPTVTSPAGEMRPGWRYPARPAMRNQAGGMRPHRRQASPTGVMRPYPAARIFGRGLRLQQANRERFGRCFSGLFRRGGRPPCGRFEVSGGPFSTGSGPASKGFAGGTPTVSASACDSGPAVPASGAGAARPGCNPFRRGFGADYL